MSNRSGESRIFLPFPDSTRKTLTNEHDTSPRYFVHAPYQIEDAVPFIPSMG